MTAARRLTALGFTAALWGATVAPVCAQSSGFALSRYEPTPTGSPFLAVESPRYSSVFKLAVGLTLQYAHNPLRYGEGVTGLSGLSAELAIIGDQLISHLDFAIPLRDRVVLHASLPVVLLERGTATAGIAPSSTIAVSDPRLGAWVRVYRQPHLDRLSVHVGASLWLPLRALGADLPAHLSDGNVRVRVAAALSGTQRAFHYSGTVGLLYRDPASLGRSLSGASGQSFPEIQLGLAASYALPRRAFTVGPEVLFSTSLLPSQALRRAASSLELLGSAQYVLLQQLQLGLGLGLGFLSAPGTPDFRLLFRVAWVPVSADRDQDGIRDDRDACPDLKGIRSDVPSNHGCPPIPDRDCDGIPDAEDECPDSPEGRHPDPGRIGCAQTRKPVAPQSLRAAPPSATNNAIAPAPRAPAERNVIGAKGEPAAESTIFASDTADRLISRVADISK